MIGWTLGRYFFTRYVQITLYFLLGIFALPSCCSIFTENAKQARQFKPAYTVRAAPVPSRHARAFHHAADDSCSWRSFLSCNGDAHLTPTANI